MSRFPRKKRKKSERAFRGVSGGELRAAGPGGAALARCRLRGVHGRRQRGDDPGAPTARARGSGLGARGSVRGKLVRFVSLCSQLGFEREGQGGPHGNSHIAQELAEHRVQLAVQREQVDKLEATLAAAQAVRKDLKPTKRWVSRALG